MMAYFEETPQEVLLSATSTMGNALSPTPSQWACSSASTFGVQYATPVPDLSIQHSVEVLVKGEIFFKLPILFTGWSRKGPIV